MNNLICFPLTPFHCVHFECHIYIPSCDILPAGTMTAVLERSTHLQGKVECQWYSPHSTGPQRFSRFISYLRHIFYNSRDVDTHFDIGR